ncbi:MAG: dPM1 [Bacteroidota bacterium]|nr:dPM1 [Bacteroidota bacterium]
MKLSLVVPAFNEEKNLDPLYTEIVNALLPLKEEYEIVFVNDGSTDDTLNVLNGLKAGDKRINVIDLRINSGQSFATMEGFKAAKGEFIVLLDADRQNDPADIPKMMALLNSEYEGVCGWRKNRKDKQVFVVSSRIANFLIRSFFGLRVHDSGCSLRVVKAQYLKDINYFKNFHRYVPIILHLKKVNLREMQVNHRWRSEGESKYSIFKSVKVLKELFYLRFVYKP